MAGTAFAANGDINATAPTISGDANIAITGGTAPNVNADAYFVSIDGKPTIEFTLAYALDDLAAGTAGEVYFISNDTTLFTKGSGKLTITSERVTTVKPGSDATLKVGAQFSLSDWVADPTDGIVINIAPYKEGTPPTKNTSTATVTIKPVELVVSADKDAVEAQEGSSAAPADVTFAVYDGVTAMTGVSFAGEAVSADGMVSGVFNKVDDTDYISTDVTAGVVKFGVGSFGPGASGNTKLAFVAADISLDLGGPGPIVYVAGVEATKKLAEVSVDVKASALKATPESVSFTRNTAEAPKTVKVSADIALTKAEFLVLSDDGKYESVASGDTVKAFTFTFGEVADKSVDFIIAFDETFAKSYDMTLVASADGHKKKFTASVKDPGTPIVTPTVELKYAETITQADLPSDVLLSNLVSSPDFALSADVKDTASMNLGTGYDSTRVGGSKTLELPLKSGQTAVPLQMEFVVAELGESVLTVTSDAVRIQNLDKSFDLFYQYVEVGSTRSADVLVGSISGAGGTWQQAYEAGIVSFAANGNIRVNYLVIDANSKAPSHNGKFIAIYDGALNNTIRDPLWLTKKKASGGGGSDSSSGVGCDAGFGAFALLGLAGLATLLRKKD